MASRFYCPSTGAAAVSPAYDAAWEDTTIAARLKAVLAKIASAMTTVAFSDSSSASRDILFRQYVSDPIAGQTIAAQTLEFQIRGLEPVNGNLMRTAIGIRVVSNDGSSVTGTILAVSRDATELATSLVNRRFTATTTQVVANANDRIVIEIGTGGDPPLFGVHDSDLRIGDASGSDLPEDDTDTNDYNPWVEFPNTITFPGDAAGVTGVIIC